MTRGKCLVHLSVYNGSSHVRETLDSVLSQDYPDYQVILTDDCSTDGTAGILAEYAARYPDKIVFRKNTVNQGIGRALFQSYREYHDADYFVAVGHDDVPDKRFLSSQIAFIRRNGCVAAFSDYRYIDRDGQPIRRSLFANETLDGYTEQSLFLRLLRSNFLMAASGVVDIARVGREDAGAFFGFDNDRLQDYELWLHLTMRGRILFNRDTFVSYRVLEGSMSDESRHVLQEKYEYCGVVRRVLFSDAFWDFLRGSPDPAELTDAIVDLLADKAERSSLLKLLLMDFAQTLFNRGMGTSRTESALRLSYFDCGMLTKSLRGAEAPPRAIKFAATDGVRARIGRLTADARCFTAATDDADILVCSADDIPAENADAVVILCGRGECERLRAAYPDALTLSDGDLTPERFLREILSYMEDHALTATSPVSARLMQQEADGIRRSRTYRIGKKLLSITDRMGATWFLRRLLDKRDGGRGQ